MALMVQGHPVLKVNVAGQVSRREFNNISCHGDAPDPSFCSVWAVSLAVHTPAGEQTCMLHSDFWVEDPVASGFC
jgi:hypothetical protein